MGEGGNAARPPCPDRDAVWFFANLTQALEECHGAEWLGERLGELRRLAGGLAPDPAVGRFLRRMGIVNSLSESREFIGPFTEHLAGAASRSPEYVLALLNLFAGGDADSGKAPVCGATPLCRRKDGMHCRLARDCKYYNSPRAPALSADTPADRLFDGRKDALSDAELLAVALFGDKGTGNEALTTALFERYGRLRAIFGVEAREYAGMREAKPAHVLRLAAFAALHGRVLDEKRGAAPRIVSAKDFYDRYAAELRDYRTEAAVLALMDSRNAVIRDAWFRDNLPTISRLEMADLIRPVIRESATNLAFIHNHPSGNPAPSESDKDFTRRLKSACGIFGFCLVDHVIVAESGYFSFAEGGLLGAL